MRGDHKTPFAVPEHQDDSVTIVANPVSGTKYEWRTGATGAGAALGNQSNVRIIGISARCSWTGAPDPLEVHVTIDGNALPASQVTPVNDATYPIYVNEGPFDSGLKFAAAASSSSANRAFMLEGRSVKIEVEVTGGVVTDLRMRVKWAKW